MTGYEWDDREARTNLRDHGVTSRTPCRFWNVARRAGPPDLGEKGDPARASRLWSTVMKKEYDFRRGKRGPVVPVPSGKTRITIRLDDDVLAWFRDQVHAAGGGNYQTLINLALRDFIAEKREPLEKTLRRVLREELAHR